MPDPLAGLIDGSDASADAPAAQSFDIEKIKSELSAELSASFEERIKGFQRLVSEKDTKLTATQRELEELKTAGLSEDEREQLLNQKVQQENQELRSRLELMELARSYGDEMPLYEKLLSAETAEEQLKVLREIRAVPAASLEPAPQADPVEIPDTDPNRPLRSVQTGQLMPDGTYMTDAMADRILASVPRMADVTQRRIVPTR